MRKHINTNLDLRKGLCNPNKKIGTFHCSPQTLWSTKGWTLNWLVQNMVGKYTNCCWPRNHTWATRLEYALVEEMSETWIPLSKSFMETHGDLTNQGHCCLVDPWVLHCDLYIISQRINSKFLSMMQPNASWSTSIIILRRLLHVLDMFVMSTPKKSTTTFFRNHVLHVQIIED